MMFSLLKKSYKWLGIAIITVILAITPAAIAQSTTKVNYLQNFQVRLRLFSN